MALSIDHIVISVNDVTTAIETYQERGFNAFYGGKHASGQTHNGLVVFDDGSYLELIAFVEPEKVDEGEFYDLVRSDKSEGYTGFALISDVLEADIARMRAAGINASDIKAGSRTRTDGEVLKWKMSSLDEGRNPFVITDETPRILRVPAEGDNIKHRNTAQGVADVRILVQDFEEAVKRYTSIVGTSPLVQDSTAIFALASGTITVATAHDDTEQDYLNQYGAVPYQLTLIGKSDTILPQEAHGARFVFTG
ncbi:MAG: VOC family protein [Anaerolineae bacterium]|nr:VOC family protein [Anaerolineae bacterium]